MQSVRFVSVRSPAIGRRVAVARGVQRVSWYGGPVAGAARCSVGSEPFLHRILYSGLAASHRGAVKRSDWHTRSDGSVVSTDTTFHTSATVRDVALGIAF